MAWCIYSKIVKEYHIDFQISNELYWMGLELNVIQFKIIFRKRLVTIVLQTHSEMWEKILEE